MNNKFRQMAIAATLVPAFALGVAADAWAAGAKAWVNTNITGWTITSSAGAGTLSCQDLISAENVAAAQGYLPVSNTANPPNGLDPGQSYSGAGSAPLPNTFTQTAGGPSLPSNAGTNYFARGDSLVPGSRNAASVVSESQINALGGANSAATHRLTCELILSQAARVTFAFNASRSYDVFITSDAASLVSSAQVAYSFAIDISQGNQDLFRWLPDGTSGPDEIDPFPLNGTISDNIPDMFKRQDSQGPSVFSVITPLLPAGNYNLAVAVGGNSGVTLGQWQQPVLACASLNVTESNAGVSQATRTSVTVGNGLNTEGCSNFVATYQITCNGDLSLSAQGPTLPAGCSMIPDPQNGPGTFTVNCPGPVAPGNSLNIDYNTIWTGTNGWCELRLIQPFTCTGVETGRTVPGEPDSCNWDISRRPPPPPPPGGAPAISLLGLVFTFSGLALISGLFYRRRQS